MINGMIARTQLAMLDHNFHVNRKQTIIRAGTNKEEKRFNVVWPIENEKTEEQNKSRKHMST